MDVDVAVEVVDERFVVAEDGGKAKLKLRIICRNEYAARWGDEPCADAPTFVGAYRDVLEIRILTGKAAGSGDILGESGMNATIGVGKRWHGNNVRREEFGDFAIFNNLRDDGMERFKLVKLFSAGGIATRSLLDAFDWEAEIYEEDFRKLDGRVKIKFLAGHRVDCLLEIFGFGGIFFLEAAKIIAI